MWRWIFWHTEHSDMDFYSINLHLALSVVCGCMLFAIYIPNIDGTSVHFPCCNSCYLLHTFSCSSGIFFIKLTAIIQMVMSEVLTRILFNPHMLCQPLFRKVCFVSLIIIEVQILHSQSENRNVRNHDCFPQFLSILSILSRLSFL